MRREKRDPWLQVKRLRAWEVGHLLREDLGQAAVELAVVIPVVLVVALIIINLGFFLYACAAFDRIAPDTALAYGSAPAGEQDAASATGQIKEAIERALDLPQVEVQVSAEPIDWTQSGLITSLAPGRIKFVCTLSYRPIPSAFSIAGSSFVAPWALEHRCIAVVDAGAVGFGV